MFDIKTVYEIMDEAFPPTEKRSFEGQKKLLEEKQYRIIPNYNSLGELSGFIAVWSFDTFNFIEHIAVSKQMRGKGIGSTILKSYIRSCNKIILLEVEPPDNEVAVKRIRFYEKLGFNLNSFYYQQPPLQDGFSYIDLKIMSYPEKISEVEFLPLKKQIYKTVYKV